MPDWLSSIAVRQAIASTIVVVMAVFVFATAALVSVERGARIDLLRTIDTDIAGLADIAVQGGPQELQRRVEDRTALDNTVGPLAFYRLTDATGHPLAGNLEGLAANGAASPTLEINDRVAGAVLVRATRLRGGLTLAVGRSLAPLRASVAELRETFIWLALIATLLSICVGTLAAWQLARRLRTINATFVDFDRGQRDATRPQATGNDEIDRLSRHVDVHLGRIEALLHSQRDITDNIAHELRTPLVHLDGRLLKALELSAQPDVDDTLRLARTDIRSIVALFDALLDIAMADASTDPHRATILDLSEIVADIGELYSASAEEAGLDFATRVAPGISIRGEAMQFTRLIANLLDNAFKYAPSGSRVRLMLAAGPTIIVEDNGPGVPAEHRQSIFKRFQRAGGDEGGHGLGLALVGVIATRHGLTARVEDAAPGSRFIVAPKETA